MPETVETEEIHFVQGLLGGPAIVSHAIGGDEDAGAVVTETAVHEDLFFGIVVEKEKERSDLIVGGRGPAADRNTYEADAERFGLLPFPGNFVGIFAAQIHNGGDAQIFEFFETFGVWLRAAKKSIIDLAAVRETVAF